jgi:hypothetical protein
MESALDAAHAFGALCAERAPACQARARRDSARRLCRLPPMPTFNELVETRIRELKGYGQAASRSRATNDVLYRYCRVNMGKMQALIEGQAEIIITKTE